MFYTMGDDWKGPYIYDMESQRRIYGDSARRNRAYYRQRGVESIVNFARFGLPAVAAHGINRYKKRFMLQDGGVSKKYKRNGKSNIKDQSLSKTKRKMVYQKNKKGGKRRRNKRKVSRKGYKRRRYVKRRKRLSSGAIQRRLLSAMATPKTLLQNFSATLKESSSNLCNYAIFDVSHTKWIYEQLIQSSDNNGNAFLSGAIDVTKSWITNSKQRFMLRNHSNDKLHVRAYVYQMKRDYSDQDYTENFTKGTRTGQYAATDSIGQAIYQGILSKLPTADHGDVAFAAADSTDNRTPTTICAADGLSHKSLLLSNIAILKKAFKPCMLPPGEIKYYNLVDNRHLKIDPHYHTNVGGNHNPMTYGGRSEFILFQFSGSPVGSAEADVGASEDFKVATGVQNVNVVWKHSISMKAISPQTYALDNDDYMPGITQANMEFMADEDIEVDGVEEG